MTKKTGQLAAESKRVRVAIAQSAPVYLDKRASLKKALDLIQQAAKRCLSGRGTVGKRFCERGLRQAQI